MTSRMFGERSRELVAALGRSERTTVRAGADPVTKTWTMRQLKQELRGFEDVLKTAGHRDTSIATYVGRSELFLRWLDGPAGTRRAVARNTWPRRHPVWPWPSGNVEHFARGSDLVVKTEGRSHRIRHGLTVRDAFGRARVRSVTWVDGKPTVEGAETETYGRDKSPASMLKINGRQHVKTMPEVPAGYQTFDVVAFHDVVTGEGVFHGLSVRIAEDDVERWARHALLRTRSKAR